MTLQYRTTDGALLYVKSGSTDLGLARQCCCSCPTGCPDVDGGVASWTLTWDTSHACVAGKLDPSHPLAGGSVTIVNVGDWQTAYGLAPCVWWKTYNNTQNVLNAPGHWACWFNYYKSSGTTLTCGWEVRLFVYQYQTGTWPNQTTWQGFDLHGTLNYWGNTDISTAKIVNVNRWGYGCPGNMPVTCTPGF